MVRVGVLGAGGRMGAEVCRAVESADDLELVAAVDPGAGPGSGGGATGGGSATGGGGATGGGSATGGPVVVHDIEELARAGAQVAVDFTLAAAVPANLAWCATHDVHAVVGTTGVDPTLLSELGDRFASAGLGLVVAPNFAIGAVLMMRFAEIAAPYMDGAEIVELHHGAKRDSPSGTALRTAHLMAEARRRAGVDLWPPDATTAHVLPGARGGRNDDGVAIHSVRLPGLVAHQEVLFGATGQSLTLRHDAYDRTSFMPGVLLAVREVASRPGLTLGLEKLLGL